MVNLKHYVPEFEDFHLVREAILITDHVLEWVTGKQAYSFLDGFLGYNQVSIAPHDQHKIAFAMEWGIFVFVSCLSG